MAEDRLQKILARGGIASRRAAESLIQEGRVRVNGKVVTELGTKADPRKDRIEVDGEKVVAEHVVYYVLHKPRGFVTTMSDPEGRPAIRELLKPYEISERIFPVGRLDFNTSGVLLLTNDGAFSDGLLHPRKAVPKTYVVKVHGKMEPRTDLDIWRNGVMLEDGKTLPAEAKFIRHEEGKTWFEITIKEGRNQQIRRMGEATGFRVMRLARVSFAGITSEDLRPGELRPLTYEELVELKKEYGVPRSPGQGRATHAAFEARPHAIFGARRTVQRARAEEREAPVDEAPRPRGKTAHPRAESAPRGRSESAPRGRSESAPRGRSESAPRGRGESAPRGRSESAPRGRSESAPRSRAEKPAAPERNPS
ncbi:MAG: pseudouridine synthase, partial [Polyangiales bacterium]